MTLAALDSSFWGIFKRVGRREIASVGGKPHVFIANFKGLKSQEIAQQAPERDVRISFAGQRGSKVYMLPLLEELQQLKCRSEVGRLACVISEIKRSVALWLDEAR